MDKPWTNHGGTMDKPSIKPMEIFIEIFCVNKLLSLFDSFLLKTTSVLIFMREWMYLALLNALGLFLFMC
jgi:hypothetical protein